MHKYLSYKECQLIDYTREHRCPFCADIYNIHMYIHMYMKYVNLFWFDDSSRDEGCLKVGGGGSQINFSTLIAQSTI